MRLYGLRVDWGPRRLRTASYVVCMGFTALLYCHRRVCRMNVERFK
jgi:hypothetical protein